MTEKLKSPSTNELLKGPTDCGMEGIQGRAEQCPYNPWRNPDQEKPNMCLQCPGNPTVSHTNLKLPEIYNKIRLSKLRDLPKPPVK